MKNIKLFKYIKKEKFHTFLSSYEYKLEDVKGFSLDGQKQYRGNILKEYCIYFKDDERAYFKVVIFRSFNEYYECKLGFNGNKMLEGYENADVRLVK